MTNLVTCIGRLLLEEESILSYFSKKRKIDELIIEFGDLPRCYSQNFGYKRKYQLNFIINDKLYREWNCISKDKQIKFKHPKQSGSSYTMTFGVKHDKFKNLCVKADASNYNCEFVNDKGDLCLQIIMTSSRNIFSVTYDQNMLSPEDVVDICGQIITYSDIN